ncbi:hypothetical protein ACG33_08795 [Steroidobacter denitrificans]|uniref:Phage capsid-like C-terminal domain-containing protein n=1 Tax=Steroidobacter denitrificans TaxID=465721 RepID=A0A127FC81_STEDE|nr:phage major capsid protein [Steroidobacter denitrificans]AMN47189.1 hypothetical protein ACG33_08795 [Steroidobacter denitrificans]
MNDEERKKFIEAVKEALAAKLKAAGITDENFIAGIKGRLDALEQIVADGGTGRRLSAPGIANPFDGEFATRVKAMHDGDSKLASFALKGMSIKRLKALVNLPEGGGSNGFPTQPQRGPTVGPAVAPLTLVDLLPSTPVGGESYEYVQLTRTPNVGVQQSEGDQKNETEFDANLVTTKIATVAHWTHASRQVLADNTQLSNILSGILNIDVMAKYEDLLINGNGTTDKIHGLVPQASVFAHTKSHPVDRLSEAIAAMWATGYVAQAVVLNPLDWSDFETERADSGDGQYVAGGWGNPAAPSVWRLPVARAAGLAEGTALILDTRRITLLDRQSVTTAVSSEDRDNFIKNLVTLLAEMRGGLAVYDTGGVVKVDLTGT